MPEKTGPKQGRAPSRAAGKTRRGELRKLVGASRRTTLRDLLARPELAPLLVLLLAFVVASSAIITAGRARPLVAVGQTMTTTQVVRQDFDIRDAEATEREREFVRRSVPLVYSADRAYFESLDASIRSLPEAVAAAAAFDALAPEIREAFALTAEQFEAVRAASEAPDAAARWATRTDRLLRELGVTPLLAGAEYQNALLATTSVLTLIRAEGEERTVVLDDALNIDAEEGSGDAELLRRLRRAAERAGFTGPLADVVRQRLTSEGRPTFVYDDQVTSTRRDEAARDVPDVIVTYRRGQTIYAEGDRLTPDQFALALEESRRHRDATPPARRAASLAGVAAVVALVTLAAAGTAGPLRRRAVAGPWRAAAVGGLSVAMLALAVWGSLTSPPLMWLTAIAPPLFFTMLMVVAMGRRAGLVLGSAQGMLTAVALGLSAGYLVVISAGVALVCWRLWEIRNRNDVVRGGLVVAGGVALAALGAGLLERPLSFGLGPGPLADGALAGAGVVVATAFALIALPWAERLFDITTGMTLSELRDPKNALLRLLQQRAPGTYNHSLNVATLAEAAADSIGADGLHAYVGALYHDIGKMNKPDYFVENQQRGFNKHDRLSPAMSLLVIVGHVKDGLELAREYALPRSLHHYIATHHGTTLVEYFYDQARRRADEDDAVDRPEEIEYRYPGPKPRTKEAAILMLCDAVESATRAMAEPTPSRIAQLVRAIARKRLTDAQFDECELTLRELAVIEDALTKTLCAIYHGRIAYPKQDTDETPGERADRVAAEQGA